MPSHRTWVYSVRLRGEWWWLGRGPECHIFLRHPLAVPIKAPHLLQPGAGRMAVVEHEVGNFAVSVHGETAQIIGETARCFTGVEIWRRRIAFHGPAIDPIAIAKNRNLTDIGHLVEVQIIQLDVWGLVITTFQTKQYI